MSGTLTIRRAHAGEAALAAHILARAFDDDPVSAWLVPDAAARPGILDAFFDVFTPFGVEAGEIHIDQSERGAALWLPFDPSDAHEDPAFGEALVKAFGPFAERFGVFDALTADRHPAHAAHAYLPFIGVKPEGQGRGIGGNLLEARLRDLDVAGTPAYLEASTLDSARLYARHGFDFLPESIDLPDGPSLYPMWREPRSA